MKSLDKVVLLAGAVFVFLGEPAFAASKPDCSAVFSFELDAKLSLRNLKVLGEPHHYESGDAYLDVRAFDTDFQPLRGNSAGIAVISASGLDASDDVIGGMVLSKQPAYFMRKESLALNRKGGLNAVFQVGQNDECAGTTYTVHFDDNGVLSVNGKTLGKVEVSPDP
jgi:hypothetical protein